MWSKILTCFVNLLAEPAYTASSSTKYKIFLTRPLLKVNFTYTIVSPYRTLEINISLLLKKIRFPFDPNPIFSLIPTKIKVEMTELGKKVHYWISQQQCRNKTNTPVWQDQARWHCSYHQPSRPPRARPSAPWKVKGQRWPEEVKGDPRYRACRQGVRPRGVENYRYPYTANDIPVWIIAVADWIMSCCTWVCSAATDVLDLLFVNAPRIFLEITIFLEKLYDDCSATDVLEVSTIKMNLIWFETLSLLWALQNAF